jgi:hypothetical protein
VKLLDLNKSCRSYKDCYAIFGAKRLRLFNRGDGSLASRYFVIGWENPGDRIAASVEMSRSLVIHYSCWDAFLV